MQNVIDQLTHILTEYYNPVIPNQRRKQIDEQFEIFFQRNDVCQICLEILKQTSNLHLRTFVTSFFEIIANRKWNYLSIENRDFIRNEICQIIYIKNTYLSKQELSKLCRIFMFIGRNDYPEIFPQYFEHINQLLNNELTQESAINIIDYSLDELLNLNSCILSTRRKLLLEHAREQYCSFILKFHEKLKKYYVDYFSYNLPQRSNSFTSKSTLSIGLSPILDNNYRALSPLPQNLQCSKNELENITNMCCIMINSVFKFFKLFPKNPVCYAEIIYTLVQFSSAPFNLINIKNECVKVVDLSVKILTDIISDASILAHNNSILMDIVEWTNNFLNNQEKILICYEEYKKCFIDFIYLFIVIYYNKYFINYQMNGINMIYKFMKFTLDLDSLDNINICLVTIHKFLVEFKSSDTLYKYDVKFTSQCYNYISELIMELLVKVLQKCIKNNQKLINDLNTENFKEFIECLQNILYDLPVHLINEKLIQCHLIESYYFISLFNIIKNENLYQNFVNDNYENCKETLFEVNSTLKCSISYYKLICCILSRTLQSVSYESITLFSQIINNSISQISLSIDFYSAVMHVKNHLSKNLLLIIKEILEFYKNSTPIINYILNDKIAHEINTLSNDSLNNNYISIVSNIISLLFAIINSNIDNKLINICSEVFNSILENISLPILSKSIDISSYLKLFQNMEYFKLNTNCLSRISMSVVYIFAKPDIDKYIPIDVNVLKNFMLIIFEKYLVYYEALSESIKNLTNPCEINTSVEHFVKISSMFSYIISNSNTYSKTTKNSIMDMSLKLSSFLINDYKLFKKHVVVYENLLGLLLSIICVFKYNMSLLTSQMVHIIVDSIKLFNKEGLYSCEYELKIMSKLIEISQILYEMVLNKEDLMRMAISVIDSFNSLLKLQKYSSLKVDYCRTLIKILVSRFNFFTKKDQNHIDEIFYRSFDVIFEEFNLQNIELVKEVLINLYNLDSRSSAYKKKIFEEQNLLLKLSIKLFEFVRDPAFSSIHDIIIDNLYQISLSNINSFYNELIPYILSQIPNIDQNNKILILQNINQVKDHPTFVQQLINLSKDINYITLINTPISLYQ